MESSKKYLWFTDCHLDKLLPWTLAKFIYDIVKENPAGVFLTGDISVGPLLCYHLKLMAEFIHCPIYFILGNHDYYFKTFEEQHQNIRDLCKQYDNLIWVTESDIIYLGNEVALIGAEGWYDARLGNPDYLKFTFDWLLIKDFKKCKNMTQRIDMFRELSKNSCKIIKEKLESALDKDYKTIYILTHMPPWKQATRDEGTFLEKYYLPYNVNLALGETIEKVMQDRKKKSVECWVGHTHVPEYIRVSRNIVCQVGAAHKLKIPHSQKIYI